MGAKKSVDIVIPVYYKEAPTLEKRLLEQVSYYKKTLKQYKWRIVVANNGPKKDILPVIKDMMKRHNQITYTDTDAVGRGIALRHTWLNSKSDFLVYMDAALAASLDSLVPMLSLLESHCDIVIGSRYVPGARVKRTVGRFILSKVYNILLNVFLGLDIADSQCGFKGITRDVARKVIPNVKDEWWFFDTEMLYVAKKMGYVVCEIPVEWYEQDETSVKLIAVSLDYIKNILRLKFSRKRYA